MKALEHLLPTNIFDDDGVDKMLGFINVLQNTQAETEEKGKERAASIKRKDANARTFISFH